LLSQRIRFSPCPQVLEWPDPWAKVDATDTQCHFHKAALPKTKQNKSCGASATRSGFELEHSQHEELPVE
jgi:hypothetical protein